MFFCRGPFLPRICVNIQSWVRSPLIPVGGTCGGTAVPVRHVLGAQLRLQLRRWSNFGAKNQGIYTPIRCTPIKCTPISFMQEISPVRCIEIGPEMIALLNLPNPRELQS
jgi:hypothetical protein